MGKRLEFPTQEHRDHVDLRSGEAIKLHGFSHGKTGRTKRNLRIITCIILGFFFLSLVIFGGVVVIAHEAHGVESQSSRSSLVDYSLQAEILEVKKALSREHQRRSNLTVNCETREECIMQFPFIDRIIGIGTKISIETTEDEAKTSFVVIMEHPLGTKPVGIILHIWKFCPYERPPI